MNIPGQLSEAELSLGCRSAAHAVRYLALHALDFGKSAAVLHEVEALARNSHVTMAERLVLLEKWRGELWLLIGESSLKRLEAELDAHGIVVPERQKKDPTP